MVIFKNIDNKLMAFVEKHHSSNDKTIVKYRTFISTFAVGVPLSAFSLLKDNTSISAQLLILGSLIFGLITAGVAVYEWRYFFLLRKKGLNKDKNYFFEESAGTFRKTAFYCCFLLSVLFELLDIGEIKQENIKYLLRADFYQLVGLNILHIVVTVIIFIELLRAVLPSAARWSNARHLMIVIIFSTILSIIQTMGLKFISGHGIF